MGRQTFQTEALIYREKQVQIRKSVGSTYVCVLYSLAWTTRALRSWASSTTVSLTGFFSTLCSGLSTFQCRPADTSLFVAPSSTSSPTVTMLMSSACLTPLQRVFETSKSSRSLLRILLTFCRPLLRSLSFLRIPACFHMRFCIEEIRDSMSPPGERSQSRGLPSFIAKVSELICTCSAAKRASSTTSSMYFMLLTTLLLPKTRPSRRLLLASLLAPCTPVQAASPMAYKPLTLVSPLVLVRMP